MKKMLVVFTLTVAGVSCAPAEKAAVPAATSAADVAAVRQAIEAANARFVQALQASDIATAAGNYTEDAVIMMPNDAAWRGHDAITKGLTDFTSQMTLTAFKATTEDVVLAGDLAIESGTYEWTLQPKTGKPMPDKGKYLTVWKHQADGSWKIFRDINNSSLPATM